MERKDVRTIENQAARKKTENSKSRRIEHLDMLYEHLSDACPNETGDRNQGLEGQDLFQTASHTYVQNTDFVKKIWGEKKIAKILRRP